MLMDKSLIKTPFYKLYLTSSLFFTSFAKYLNSYLINHVLPRYKFRQMSSEEGIPFLWFNLLILEYDQKIWELFLANFHPLLFQP